MTGTIVLVVAIAVLVALVAVVAVSRRGTRGRVRPEPLGAPPGAREEPLIRPESRHHDTPAGADLDTPGGREHRRS